MIEVMLEYGDPVPMSLEEAMAYHSQPLAEYGDPVPVLSTTFETVEVEVPVESFQAVQGRLMPGTSQVTEAVRNTLWGPRPSDWPLVPWASFAKRSGTPTCCGPGLFAEAGHRARPSPGNSRTET